MPHVSLFRLYLLRAVYLLVATGLAIVVWPGVFHRAHAWELMEGVVQCMLVSFSLLCLLGLRYPLQMLPVLLWELGWKVLWLLVVAVPQWSSGTMDEHTWSVAASVLLVVLVPVAMPWRYAYARFVSAPGARWRGAGITPPQYESSP
jgi:hypothetical protein